MSFAIGGRQWLCRAQSHLRPVPSVPLVDRAGDRPSELLQLVKSSTSDCVQLE